MFQVQDYNDMFLYVYVFVDDALKEVTQQMGFQLKSRCELKAAEVLTIQIVGELMEKKTETAIYMLLKEYKHLFNADISRSSFYKQLKKFAWLLEYLVPALSEKFDNDSEVVFPDGFPIPVKKMVRRFHGVDVNGRAAVGFCASLKEYFYGLKGHILVGKKGFVRKLILTPGNVHDVKVIEQLLEDENDITAVCDKGYIDHEIAEIEKIQKDNIILTEKRKNQIGYKEHNKKLKPLMKERKIVECVISHLERLNAKVMKQRAFWTVKMRMLSKCMAIGCAIAYNLEHRLKGLLRMKVLHPEFN